VAEIMGSIPARSMNIYPRFSLLYCFVSVEILRWADPPFKKTY
jgi:hypothetical protein